MTQKITMEWLQENTIPIGSRALGVEKEDSDFDFAILKSKVPQELFDRYETAYLSTYCDLNPPMGNNIILKGVSTSGKKIDFLVYEHESSIEIIRKAMIDMKMVPKYMLIDKRERVELFQLALEHYGFKRKVEEVKRYQSDDLPL